MTRQGNVQADAGRSRRWPAIAVAVAVVAAGIALSQSSTAYWNDAKDTQTLQIVAGTAGVTVTAPVNVDGALLSPGATVSFTDGRLTNTGNANLVITVRRSDADAFAGDLAIRVGQSSANGSCTPSIAVPAGQSVSLTPTSLAAGAQLTLCATVTLPTASTRGSGARTSVTLTFEGTQP